MREFWWKMGSDYVRRSLISNSEIKLYIPGRRTSCPTPGGLRPRQRHCSWSKTPPLKTDILFRHFLESNRSRDSRDLHKDYCISAGTGVTERSSLSSFTLPWLIHLCWTFPSHHHCLRCLGWMVETMTQLRVGNLDKGGTGVESALYIFLPLWCQTRLGLAECAAPGNRPPPL